MFSLQPFFEGVFYYALPTPATSYKKILRGLL